MQSSFSEINKLISLYSSAPHGGSNVKELFVAGVKNEFAPLSFIIKKVKNIQKPNDLIEIGYSYLSLEINDYPGFDEWFNSQYSIKLTNHTKKNIFILYPSDDQTILNSLSKMDFLYQILHKEKILLNNKHFTTQLGEWYARIIFGIMAKKSMSSKGFDFFLENIPVEIKVAWPEKYSPKGIRLSKTSLENNTFLIIIYLSRNFLIRDILFLDTKQYLFNQTAKGEIFFIKESNIKKFLFSKSNYFLDKVINSNILLKFSTPTLAIKIENFFTNSSRKNGVI